MTHPQLEESGLSVTYGFSSVADDPQLAKFLGKTVRYKRELLTKAFVRANGAMCKGCKFVIREVQKNHQGDTVLRGYAVDVGDTFGSPINPEHVEIV